MSQQIKSPSKMRSILRKLGSLVDEKRNAREFWQLLDFTLKQDSDPLSINSVIKQLGSQFNLQKNVKR